jgi:hypothetical protein
MAQWIMTNQHFKAHIDHVLRWLISLGGHSTQFDIHDQQYRTEPDIETSDVWQFLKVSDVWPSN